MRSRRVGPGVGIGLFGDPPPRGNDDPPSPGRTGWPGKKLGGGHGRGLVTASPAGTSTGSRQLDDSISVTRPSAWLALAAVVVLIVVAVVVACVVHVPKIATAQGTVVFSGGRLVVTSPIAGKVESLEVAVGNLVWPGDPLARVRGSDGSRRTLVAPEIGTVLSVPVSIGQAVGAGEVVAGLSRWRSEADVSLIAFVSPAESANFPKDSKVRLSVRDLVRTGTVTRVPVVRMPLESVAEVVGDEALAREVYERTDGSPIALLIDPDPPPADRGGSSSVVLPAGTAVAVSRVVSDPTLWEVVFGGGR